MQSRPRQFRNQYATAIVINGRFRTQRITGVQRYAHEIVDRLQSENEVLFPAFRSGSIGHLCEQTILPFSCHGRLLWSPNASGPLSYCRQVVAARHVKGREPRVAYASGHGKGHLVRVAYAERGHKPRGIFDGLFAAD